MFESGTLTHKATNSAVANEDLEGLPQDKDQELESKASTALMSLPVERESAESLKQRLAAMEYILKQKTTATLAKSKLVQNFQTYKEDVKVKNWKQIHQFEKSQVAGIKLEAAQIKNENKGLNQELTRMKRALEQQRKEQVKKQ